MSSTRTAGRRDSRPPGARTARTTRTTSRRASSSVAAPVIDPGDMEIGAGRWLRILATPSRRRRRPIPSQGTPRTRVPRHRMLLVCTAALAAGFFAVLLLNTVISQGAFRQHELEIELILLAEKEEALARSVQQAEAPLEVEKAARKLGMVPAAAPRVPPPVRRQGAGRAGARTRADRSASTSPAPQGSSPPRSRPRLMRRAPPPSTRPWTRRPASTRRRGSIRPSTRPPASTRR